MFNFHQNTLEELRDNFRLLLLTDRDIISLFLIASQYDTEEECPTAWGNYDAFIDIKCDEWIVAIYDESVLDELDAKAMLRWARADIVCELKNLIPDEKDF